MDVERSRGDYETFLRDLEEDREMRNEVNLYKHPSAFLAAAQQPAGAGKAAAKGGGRSDDDDDDDDDGISEAEVGLEELLDDLSLNENETFDERDEPAPPAFALPHAGTFHFT